MLHMSKTQIPVRGGCHCGAVQYEVLVGRQLLVHKCNCSICSKSGYLHLIVPAEDFRLLSGKDESSEYRFNTGTARHLFCSQCGIKSFYVPRSNPDGFSVNVNCLELPGEIEITVEEFDGQNWEQHAGALEHLSKAD
jgi:hypothetical protein